MSNAHLACPACGAENHANGVERLTCRSCGAIVVLVEGAAIQLFDTPAARPLDVTASTKGAPVFLKNFFVKMAYGIVGMILAGIAVALAGIHFTVPPGVDPTIGNAAIVVVTGFFTGLAATVKRWAASLGNPGA